MGFDDFLNDIISGWTWCVSEGYPTKHSRGWWLAKTICNSKTSLEYFETSHWKFHFCERWLATFSGWLSKIIWQFQIIYSRTTSQFQVYSLPKKQFYANLKQKNGLVKRRIVSLCGNSFDASRSICIPLPWYQSVAWTKRGMKHWEGWICFDLRLWWCWKCWKWVQKKRGFLMFLNDPSYSWHRWFFCSYTGTSMNIPEDGKRVLNILIIITSALCRKPICKRVRAAPFWVCVPGMMPRSSGRNWQLVLKQVDYERVWKSKSADDGMFSEFSWDGMDLDMCVCNYM